MLHLTAVLHNIGHKESRATCRSGCITLEHSLLVLLYWCLFKNPCIQYHPLSLIFSFSHLPPEFSFFRLFLRSRLPCEYFPVNLIPPGFLQMEWGLKGSECSSGCFCPIALRCAGRVHVGLDQRGKTGNRSQRSRFQVPTFLVGRVSTGKAVWQTDLLQPFIHLYGFPTGRWVHIASVVIFTIPFLFYSYRI